MFALHDEIALRLDEGRYVTADSPMRAQRICEQIGRFFRREGHFDFAPITAGYFDNAVVRLVDSPGLLAHARIIGGAFGLDVIDGKFGVSWVWLHPYLRGQGVFKRECEMIRRKYPNLPVHGPFTDAGARAFAKIGWLPSDNPSVARRVFRWRSS